MPYYGLDSNGNLERRGNFLGGRPGLTSLFWLLGKSEIARYFRIGVRHTIGDDDFRLIAKMFAESRNAFSRSFNSERFFVLIYPGSTSANRLIPYLHRNGVQYFDYSTLFDPAQGDLTIKGDPHPTPKAYRIVAERLTQDLGLLDEEAMNRPGLSGRTELAFR
jgi:hypothetical protein